MKCTYKGELRTTLMNGLHYRVKGLFFSDSTWSFLKTPLSWLPKNKTNKWKDPSIKESIHKIDLHLNFSSDVTPFHDLICLHQPSLDVGKSVS